MREDSRSQVHEVREIKWVGEGWPEADGDGVIIHTISGGIHCRSRCSWEQFIKYHEESAVLIEEFREGNRVEALRRFVA